MAFGNAQFVRQLGFEAAPIENFGEFIGCCKRFQFGDALILGAQVIGKLGDECAGQFRKLLYRWRFHRRRRDFFGDAHELGQFGVQVVLNGLVVDKLQTGFLKLRHAFEFQSKKKDSPYC